MVSTFMVHPDLQLTRCDASCVAQIAKYQRQLKQNAADGDKSIVEAEVEYLMIYSRIVKIVETYFSKPELSYEDECTGLDYLAEEMEKFKKAEKVLAGMKGKKKLGVIEEE